MSFAIVVDEIGKKVWGVSKRGFFPHGKSPSFGNFLIEKIWFSRSLGALFQIPVPPHWVLSTPPFSLVPFTCAPSAFILFLLRLLITSVASYQQVGKHQLLLSIHTFWTKWKLSRRRRLRQRVNRSSFLVAEQKDKRSMTQHPHHHHRQQSGLPPARGRPRLRAQGLPLGKDAHKPNQGQGSAWQGCSLML